MTDRLPKWVRVRQKRLVKMCRSIQRRKDAGQPVTRAIRTVSKWAMNYRELPDGKLLRASETGLLRLWYRWLKLGEAGLKLNYKAGQRKRTPELAAQFKAVCLEQGRISFSGAWRALRAGGVQICYNTALRILPERDRAQVERLFRIRRTLSQAVAKCGGRT